MTDTVTPPIYRGRFAPSPTGPLHFGSLVAALGSFLQARAHGGEWWLRIEDIDPPREAPGARDAILAGLEAHGLHWDGPVRYQSDRHERYAAALDQLAAGGRLFACDCTRKRIAEYHNSRGGELRYPGWCRERGLEFAPGRALRLDTRRLEITFHDAIQGRQTVRLEAAGGDFVLRRSDGLFSYQLAVALDDADQGMTEVVRGSDLLESTPRQIAIQQLLSLPTPRYAHLPVAVDASGRKLSKQNRAPALDLRRAGENLWQALRFLGQNPPADLRRAEPVTLLEWARAQWRLKSVPQMAAMEVAPDADPSGE